MDVEDTWVDVRRYARLGLVVFVDVDAERLYAEDARGLGKMCETGNGDVDVPTIDPAIFMLHRTRTSSCDNARDGG